MKRADIATPEEVLEMELAIIQAAGVKVKHVGYQKASEGEEGFHLYDVLEPKIPGYFYDEYDYRNYPTLSFEGMKEIGLFRMKEIDMKLFTPSVYYINALLSRCVAKQILTSEGAIQLREEFLR